MFYINKSHGLMLGSALLLMTCVGCYDESASEQTISSDAPATKSARNVTANKVITNEAATASDTHSDLANQPPTKESASPKTQDKDNATASAKASEAFMQAADQIDLAEIKIGKMAEEHASSDVVKKYAERLVSDHTKMNKGLRDIASKQGITLKGDLDAKHQGLFDRLSALKAGDFDQTFASDMVAGHKQAITRFEEEVKDGKNADVKTWAQKWLPTLREHLTLAETAVQDIANTKGARKP